MAVCEICDKHQADQPALFEAAVEAVSVGAFWTHPGGWSASVVARRSGQCWHLAARSEYGQLSSDELVDVLLAELALALGVR